MNNILTVDVEDWYQAIENIPFGDWPNFESRIEKNVDTLLEILNDYQAKATFFILGYEAERHPDLVKRIFDEGHEVAVHGLTHRLIYSMGPDEFRRELRLSKDLLESIIKQRVFGHRAPAWSITSGSLWALDILLEEGFSYDSSIAPLKNYLYGLPNASRFPAVIRKKDNSTLVEFPMSTIRIFNLNLPFAGGFFTRLLPYPVIKSLIRKTNHAGYPVMIWLHPWDLDVHQPRLKLPWHLKRHYYNLSSTEAKLRSLLREFKFTPIKDILKRYV